VGGLLQLALLEEVRQPEPPIRLGAMFYEPGSAAQIASELRALSEFVVAIGAPVTSPSETERQGDEMLRSRGLPPVLAHPEALALAESLADLGLFSPAEEAGEGQVAEGAFREAPIFETNPDAVFCCLQARRLPAKRHPHGLRLRIAELTDDHVEDDGGDLWSRRIEEIDAAAAALCAHRYAVAHASWVGDPAEGVIVLPGSSVPEEFTTRGVLEAVERLEFRN
jgi:predicted nuclease with RNAse H fold